MKYKSNNCCRLFKRLNEEKLLFTMTAWHEMLNFLWRLGVGEWGGDGLASL